MPFDGPKVTIARITPVAQACCMMVTCPIDVGCVLVAVGVHPGIAKTE